MTPDFDIDPDTGCWLWKRKLNHDGYGRLRINGKDVMAHRHYYTMFKGEIPRGITIDHLCRVRNCVNPDHLEAVENAENVRRMMKFKMSRDKNYVKRWIANFKRNS